MRTFAVALPILLVSVAVTAQADDVAALIQKQSQEFSDASASGDAATIGKYLDDRVIFMNETGEIGNRKDILDGTQPSPTGVSNKLVQTDFKIEVHDNVAVTSFIDNSTQSAYGQTIHVKYQSTEVWMKESDGWKMISSQTMTVAEDPPTIVLPATLLDEYVGTYEATSALKLQIARDGDGLTGSINGGKRFAIKTELRDVLVTPGQPTLRRIVQRDDKGKIIGIVSLRGGHDLSLKRVG